MGRAGALTGVEVHGDVQQVERVAQAVQAQPQHRVLLLELGEAGPGGTGTVTGLPGAGPSPRGTPLAAAPAPTPQPGTCRR